MKHIDYSFYQFIRCYSFFKTNTASVSFVKCTLCIVLKTRPAQAVTAGINVAQSQLFEILYDNDMTTYFTKGQYLN